MPTAATEKLHSLVPIVECANPQGVIAKVRYARLSAHLRIACEDSSVGYASEDQNMGRKLY